MALAHRTPDKDARFKYLLMSKVPAFRQLDGNANADTLMNVYRDLGADKLVTELEGQDLGRAVAFFKGRGF